MLFINGLNFDPTFNLACEEFLLHTFEDEIFMLWQNEKSIVIGKHQNALAEINLPYTLQHSIPVIRRLSGGGTVFHDRGNINFTFIRNADDREKMIDFRKYASPILLAMKDLGIDAYFSERNDIFIEGLKVSGNAEHLFQKKKRVLHHGTLLFNSQLDELNEAIRTDPERYQDKAVNSVRSKVANIADYLSEPLTVAEFKEHIFQYVWNAESAPVSYSLSSDDILKIEALSSSKYATWDWNFGYSPQYTVNRNLEFNGASAFIHFKVEKGRVVDIDCADLRLHSILNRMHNPDDIGLALSGEFTPDIVRDLTFQLF